MIHQLAIAEDGSQKVLVHFVYLSPRGTTHAEGEPLQPTPVQEMTWKLACAPLMVELPALGTRAFPYQRTDDPRAVNCHGCMKSQEYKMAMSGLEAALGRQT